MKKNYILDTSTIIFDKNCLENFKDAKIIIHISVLNELDKLKSYTTEAGKSARSFIRMLDNLSKKGDINDGIKKDNLIIKVDTKDYNCEFLGDANYGDNRMLACALAIKEKDPIIITKDISFRIRARALGLKAINYKKYNYTANNLHKGYTTVKNTKHGIRIRRGNSIELKNNKDLKDLLPNECISFTDENNQIISLGKRNCKFVHPLNNTKPWNLSSKNIEQAFAIDLLLDKNVPLVTLSGMAGTGKSLIAVACGLESVISKKQYSNLIIYRPTKPVGDDIGFLPGDVNEKLEPWMAAIHDSLEYLVSDKSKHKRNGSWRDKLAQYSDQIKLEALTHLRGRSIPNAYIIVDECFPYNQNIKTESGKCKIGKLVKDFKKGKQTPKVKTFNEKTKEFEFKKITNVWERKEQETIELKMANRKIKCTPNHKFLTKNGWIKANDIKLGELILTSEPNEHQLINALNNDQMQLIIGSYLGDGNISNHGLSRYRLRVVHGINQLDYCKWKANVLNVKTSILKKNGYSNKPAIKFNSKIFGLEKIIKNKKNIPQWLINKIDVKALAIWYMDDGSLNKNSIRLSTCSFDQDSHERLCKKLLSFNIKSKIRKYKGYRYIDIPTKSSKIFFNLIHKYIHESMNYKLPQQYKNLTKYIWNKNFCTYGFTVLDSKTKSKKMKVYDIEVEDNHNFILCSSSTKKNQGMGGPIAHNCQNISKKDIKTILTRVGHNTKIVLTGDIEQIDDFRLDAIDNGLTYVIENFKDSELAGHMSLTKGERSLLASEAAKVL